MNRMVECGGCDSRFRINEDVIMRERKFYPGEKAAPDLRRFQRVPMSAGPPPAGLKPMRYEDFNSPEKLGPVSPQRIVAGIFGVFTMVIVALLFLFATGPTSSITLMPLENKLIIAGFVSLLGLILLIYANPKARIKATFVGLMLCAGLIAIPLFVKETPQREITGDDFSSTKDLNPFFPGEEDKEFDPLDELRERFSTKPLDKERNRLTGSGSDRKAFGIYITQMIERNKYTVRDFLTRETEADLSSHLFPRENGNYLMVLTDVTKSIEEVADIVSKLGETVEIHPEVGVIVVRVNNNQFIAGDADKLNDRNHPMFYKHNLDELGSIDLDRVQLAVERLADVEPSIFRSDITTKLIEIMTKPGVTFHDSLSRALLNWSTDPAPAAVTALEVLQQYVAKDQVVPEDLVALAAHQGNIEAMPSVVTLWTKNPILWDKYLVKFGPAAEEFALQNVDSDSAALSRSAVSILGQVGSDSSLPALRKALEKDDPELRVLAERSIKQIEER